MACCPKSLPTTLSPRLQSAHAYPQPCTLPSLLWPTHISLNAHHTTALFFLSSPALLKLYRGGDACILPLSHKYPRTPACPQANVLVPPTAPWSLHPAHSAITLNSVSCFPRALSDKFIKLRDDTVNGHIKKGGRKRKRREGERRLGASLPPCSQGHISTLPRSCGQAGRGIFILHHL